MKAEAEVDRLVCTANKPRDSRGCRGDQARQSKMLQRPRNTTVSSGPEAFCDAWSAFSGHHGKILWIEDSAYLSDLVHAKGTSCCFLLITTLYMHIHLQSLCAKAGRELSRCSHHSSVDILKPQALHREASTSFHDNARHGTRSDTAPQVISAHFLCVVNAITFLCNITQFPNTMQISTASERPLRIPRY